MNLAPRSIPLLLVAAVSLAGESLAAEPPVGYVKVLSGEVNVIDGDAVTRAAVGTPVSAGSTLKTGSGASVGLALRDNTLISLGPDTEFSLREYAYEPGEGKLALVSRLARGTLNYVSGVIAKLRPEAVAVETPTGTLGVRGTQFVAKVNPEEAR